MAQIRSSLSGFTVATLGAGGTVASIHSMIAGANGKSLPTVDAVMLDSFVAGVTFLAPFLAAHIAMLFYRRSSASIYALAGGVSFLIAFLASGGIDYFALLGDHGMGSVAILLPLAWGCALGGIYFALAGYERLGDDPDKLAAWLGMQAQDAGEPPVATPGETYYNGPVQVRTSIPLMMVSSLIVPGGLGLLMALLTATGVAISRFTPLPITENWEAAESMTVLVRALFLLITFTVIGGGLTFIPTLVAHLITRKVDATTNQAYATAGTITALVMGVLLTPLLLTIFSCPVALVVYRKLAGLEPRGLPEDVIVRDPRTLVPADHARRRYRLVIDETPGRVIDGNKAVI